MDSRCYPGGDRTAARADPRAPQARADAARAGGFHTKRRTYRRFVLNPPAFRPPEITLGRAGAPPGLLPPAERGLQYARDAVAGLAGGLPAVAREAENGGGGGETEARGEETEVRARGLWRTGRS